MKFKWTKIEQDTFDEIKRIFACDTLLTYPDFNEEFKIITDTRDFQLGAVTGQKFKPVAFHSRKLTYTQKNDTVIEKDMLIIIETLK